MKMKHTESDIIKNKHALIFLSMPVTKKLSSGIKKSHYSPLCPSASEMCAKKGRKSTHIRTVVCFLAWGRRREGDKVVRAWSRAVSDRKEGVVGELRRVWCTRSGWRARYYLSRGKTRECA